MQRPFLQNTKAFYLLETREGNRPSCVLPWHPYAILSPSSVYCASAAQKQLVQVRLDEAPHENGHSRLRVNDEHQKWAIEAKLNRWWRQGASDHHRSGGGRRDSALLVHLDDSLVQHVVDVHVWIVRHIRELVHAVERLLEPELSECLLERGHTPLCSEARQAQVHHLLPLPQEQRRDGEILQSLGGGEQRVRAVRRWQDE
mmetsp:Transcript_40169/g.84252  ORF Transcript_40169/g.84252 Transcript_40169/m.84252 type:complete len:201 (-) Transcript_40169:884-1486(-)